MFYCRKYVSPSGTELKTCTEVTRHLRAQPLIDVSGLSKEGEIGQINNGSCILPKSIDEVPDSVHHEVTNNLSGTYDLYDVKIDSFIDCYPCGLKFDDMGGLEKHLTIFHKKTTRRLNLPTRDATQCTFEKMDLYQHAVIDHDEPQLDQVLSPQNEQSSFISRKIAKAQESVPIVNANIRFMTTCTWCNREFLCGPVDAETMAEAAGYMCPKCQKKACGVFETLKGES
ncbi:uncharacterized protein [Rutidosis leptorrhynchoides]|uniref:uncharacterized protein isoform X2 n=1 Tax=Rutidosis leptorrhynchoides TaxID=125765 RepID=UPI003A997982